MAAGREKKHELLSQGEHAHIAAQHLAWATRQGLAAGGPTRLPWQRALNTHTHTPRRPVTFAAPGSAAGAEPDGGTTGQSATATTVAPRFVAVRTQCADAAPGSARMTHYSERYSCATAFAAYQPRSRVHERTHKNSAVAYCTNENGRTKYWTRKAMFGVTVDACYPGRRTSHCSWSSNLEEWIYSTVTESGSS